MAELQGKEQGGSWRSPPSALLSPSHLRPLSVHLSLVFNSLLLLSARGGGMRHSQTWACLGNKRRRGVPAAGRLRGREPSRIKQPP